MSTQLKINPRFIELSTQDGLVLPGLLYAAPRSKRVAIYLHGNGSSSVFYKQSKLGPMAEALNKQGISLLCFNNRGAELMKRLVVQRKRQTEKKLFGMAYEKIKDCVHDIDGAITFLKGEGYNQFFLVGESTGANKICVYQAYKRNKSEISKNILLAGGDDTGLNYASYGKKAFWKLLAKAENKIRQGAGEEIAPETLKTGPFSYQSFFDIANPDGDYNVFPYYEVINEVKLSKKRLFRHFTSIKQPSFVVYGASDEYAWGDVPRVITILKSHQPTFDYAVIPDTGHSFRGKEKELAKVIANWLK